MERRQFLQLLGITAAATCAGCLISCSKSGNGISPGGNSNPSAVSVDLNSQLLQVGDYIVTNGIIIARLSSGNTPSDFTALSAFCTHQGTIVSYVASQNLFYCPAHGSEFSTSGTVLRGPASAPLKQYTVQINNNILTVG
ncbi:QcrA and Rieske domain-containing protein [Thermoflavifilum thermophilum]|uniref:Cytochrome b6-f complex iron-sulfur subunit n=1 Tax=Thermoflavifilum thermophilum TaxID=1393122 RepID=A0A1I7NHG0_9BACT|nr:ubiquinol-cytochrome c reductase iron-sulfur subunit [Thermoflavifilum thermophilum]SFV34105.1 cytochrome b6-f complex iron-sulfur subunit [Thermoflavifilum thermophilum]